MPCPRLVVIGASAGGIEVVREVLAGLGSNFPAAVLVVIHTGAEASTSLRSVLARAVRIPVDIATDGLRLQPGRVYVPPADYHLLLDDDRVALSRGPRQHGFRPAVDPLFISAANACRDRVIGVIMSGALGDGTLGLLAVKRAGGIAIVQNPEEAAFPSMPLTALKSVEVDYVLPVDEIAARLIELVQAPPRAPRHVYAAATPAASARRERKSRAKSGAPQPTGLVCPSCGGALLEQGHEGVEEFICHVGHHFSPEALQALQADHLDRVLWTAVRALQDDARLRNRMSAHAERRGLRALASEWSARARDAESNAATLKQVVEGMTPPEARKGPPRSRPRKEQARKQAAPRGRPRGRRTPR